MEKMLEKTMKDFRGNTVNVGDRVVFFYRTSTGGGSLQEGKVIAIYRHSGMDIARIEFTMEWPGWNGEVRRTTWTKNHSSTKIMKLND